MALISAAGAAGAGGASCAVDSGKGAVCTPSAAVGDGGGDGAAAGGVGGGVGVEVTIGGGGCADGGDGSDGAAGGGGETIGDVTTEAGGGAVGGGVVSGGGEGAAADATCGAGAWDACPGGAQPGGGTKALFGSTGRVGAASGAVSTVAAGVEAMVVGADADEPPRESDVEDDSMSGALAPADVGRGPVWATDPAGTAACVGAEVGSGAWAEATCCGGGVGSGVVTICAAGGTTEPPRESEADADWISGALGLEVAEGGGVEAAWVGTSTIAVGAEVACGAAATGCAGDGSGADTICAGGGTDEPRDSEADDDCISGALAPAAGGAEAACAGGGEAGAATTD